MAAGYTGPRVTDRFPNAGGKTAGEMTDAEIMATMRGFAEHFGHVSADVECGDTCETTWEYYGGDIMPVVAEAFARGMIT